jgi:PIN domain nuclease of toxin-antitoxin system
VKFAIDASAILALLNDEPGGDRVEQYLEGGAVSAVNLVEVGTRLIDAGMSSAAAQQTLGLLGLEVMPFDADQAELAIGLRVTTRDVGLSLGDRACLALALHENGAAVTADRVWAKLDLGIAVQVIR